MPDPDQPCLHEDFLSEVQVHRLFVDDDYDPDRFPDAFAAEVRVWCTQCDEVFRFLGCPAGVLPDRPTCSVDGSELRVPIRPSNVLEGFGLGLPGFTVNVDDDPPEPGGGAQYPDH